jgi:ribosomal protein S18 acetylase RimI-like enzyme
VGFELVRAAPADREAVVATIVAAFASDPAFRYFFPDDATYPSRASAFAGYLFDKRVGLGTVWIAEAGSVAALWDPPSSRATDDHRLELPTDALHRIERYDCAVHPLLPDGPFWYLGVLATHPERAGQRLGRRLMAAGVTAAHADGLPAVLETMNPSNVELYRREGWEVVGRTDGTDVPTTWVLVNA